MMVNKETLARESPSLADVRSPTSFKVSYGSKESPIGFRKVTVEPVDPGRRVRPAEGMSSLVNLPQSQTLAEIVPNFGSRTREQRAPIALRFGKVEIATHENRIVSVVNQPLELSPFGGLRRP